MNWALFSHASQSTTLNNNQASRAVDGNTWTLSITHVNDYNPWWKVRLSDRVWVTHVEIGNLDYYKGI